VSYGLGVQTLLCVVESNNKEWHEDFIGLVPIVISTICGSLCSL
jgi:hypothetical protein